MRKIKEARPGTAITESCLRQRRKGGVLSEPKAKGFRFGGIRPAAAGR